MIGNPGPSFKMSCMRQYHYVKKCRSSEDTEKKSDRLTHRSNITSNYLQQFDQDRGYTNHRNHMVYLVTIRFLSESE